MARVKNPSVPSQRALKTDILPTLIEKQKGSLETGIYNVIFTFEHDVI